MREFDLEAAKRGDPIVCRDGTPATFIAHVPEAHYTQRLVVLVGDNIYGYLESGQWTGIKNDHADLFMAPKKRTVWVNLYKSKFAYHCDTEEEANKRAKDTDTANRIGGRAWPVEIEE